MILQSVGLIRKWKSALGLQARRVMPQPLEIVKVPLLMIENMDYHVIKIEQYPFAFSESFGPAGIYSFGAQFIFQIFQPAPVRGEWTCR